MIVTKIVFYSNDMIIGKAKSPVYRLSFLRKTKVCNTGKAKFNKKFMNLDMLSIKKSKDKSRTKNTTLLPLLSYYKCSTFRYPAS